MVGKERDVRVDLIDQAQHRDAGIKARLLLKVGTDPSDVALGVGFEIEVERIVGVRQQQTILLWIAEQRHGNAMNIVAIVALHVLVGIGRLHHVDGSHQSGVLIHGIPVDYDVLDDRAELLVSARLQPSTDTSVAIPL